MLEQCVRFVLMAGVCLAGTTIPARADDAPKPPALCTVLSDLNVPE